LQKPEAPSVRKGLDFFNERSLLLSKKAQRRGDAFKAVEQIFDRYYQIPKLVIVMDRPSRDFPIRRLFLVPLQPSLESVEL